MLYQTKKNLRFEPHISHNAASKLLKNYYFFLFSYVLIFPLSLQDNDIVYFNAKDNVSI